MKFLLFGYIKNLFNSDLKKNTVSKLDDATLYKESANNHRYFLNWRQLLFGGFFAIVAWIINQTIDAIQNHYGYFAFIFPLIGVIIGFAFRKIEKRNTELYHSAIETCKKLENEKEGFYNYINIHVKGSSHTETILDLYLGASITFIIFAIALFVVFTCQCGVFIQGLLGP